MDGFGLNGISAKYISIKHIHKTIQNKQTTVKKTGRKEFIQIQPPMVVFEL